MKVEFSDHARHQRKKRAIDRIHILDTVKNPDEVINSYRSRKLYRKWIQRKLLEVVTVKERDTIIIVTAYYLDK